MTDSLARATHYFLDSSQRDQVDGYLQATQARAIHALLQQQLASDIRGSLVEIGVFKGKTLIGLARAAREGERSVGVDPMMIGKHDLMPELAENVRRHLDADERARLSITRVLSTELDPLAWIRLLKTPARFVHLGGHPSRETMLHDMQLAAAWLVKGAVVVIDDFLNELHPDLTSGIFDALAVHPQLEPIAVIPRMGHIEEGGSKLVCTTRGEGAAYLKALDTALADELRPWNDRMLGRDVRVYRVAKSTLAEASPLTVIFALRDEDGSFWANTAVAMTSLAQYSTVPLSVHILHDETLHEMGKKRFRQIAAEMGFGLTLNQVELPADYDAARLRQFGPASLYRLMIPRLFADEELVIYLDSDMVLNGLDIRTLVERVPLDTPISAVVDRFIGVPAPHAAALARLPVDIDKYFNSGVLALRPRLLPPDLLGEFIAWSGDNPEATHPDQDFLNVRFQGVVHLLPPMFNVQVGLIEQGLLKPLDRYAGKLLHYVGSTKPLTGVLAPGVLPFWAHANRTPEIHQGSLYNGTAYLLPAEHSANAVKRLRLGYGRDHANGPTFED